ncbi:MAG: diacylglycerol/lipid kinase family protein [Rhodoblastus sp.]
MSATHISVRRVLIVANPQARRYAPRKIAAIAAALARKNCEVAQEISQARGDIERIVAARGAGFDAIAAHGGDGTINETLSGLRAICGAQPALALIPGGTINVLAIETGAARGAHEIAETIAAGRIAPLHYGLANGRPFVLMASAGLDATVVAATSPRLKARLGGLAYLATAVAHTFGARTPDIRVTAGGETIRCRLAICANAARYGGNFLIAPQTGATRPGLALALVADDGFFALLRIGARMLGGRGISGAGVRVIEVNQARLEAEGATGGPEVAVQIDGDPFGTTPVEAVCADAPVRLIVKG